RVPSTEHRAPPPPAVPLPRLAGKLADMHRERRNPNWWALWSFIAGFPVGWVVACVVGGDFYDPGALPGGMITGSIAAILGRQRAIADNRLAPPAKRPRLPNDQRRESN
ncbi:MAG TPA: hypothetical protein VM452_04365, partial [Caulifigura sp.]|nr:hypothetical protein [Caulifigura sp.]